MVISSDSRKASKRAAEAESIPATPEPRRSVRGSRSLECGCIAAPPAPPSPSPGSGRTSTPRRGRGERGGRQSEEDEKTVEEKKKQRKKKRERQSEFFFCFFFSKRRDRSPQRELEVLVTDSFSHSPPLSLSSCVDASRDEKAPLSYRRVELGWRSSRCPGERRVPKGVGAGEKKNLRSFIAAKHGFEATDQSVAQKFCLVFRVSRWCWWGLSQLEGSVLRPRKKEKKQRRENDDA